MNDPAKSLKTIKDLEALGDERAELVNGEIFLMAPQVARHSNAQAAIAGALRGKARGTNASGGTDNSGIRILTEAWTHYETHNSFSHDIAGFWYKDLPKLPEKGPIKVIPYWVCEVLSPSNWVRDAEVKRRVLERFRVPYFWIVDPMREGIQVFELVKGAEHYQLLTVASKEDGMQKLAPFLDVEIDLKDVFG